MPEATRSIEIDVPIDKFFEVIADFERYPEFQPECKSCRIDSDQGNVKTVQQTLSLMKKINMTLRMELDPPRRLSWTLIKGDMMKANNGRWELEEAGEGRTRATYFLEIKLKGLIPGSIVTKMAETSLPAMLKKFKERAEQLHG